MKQVVLEAAMDCTNAAFDSDTPPAALANIAPKSSKEIHLMQSSKAEATLRETVSPNEM